MTLVNVREFVQDVNICALASRQPWDNLDHESADWYNRFVHYLLLPTGRRSIRAAWFAYSQDIGADVSAAAAPPEWYKYSQEHEWERRAAAYDHYHDRQRLATAEEEHKQIQQEIREALRGTLRKLYASVLAAPEEEVPLSTAITSIPRYASELDATTRTTAQDALTALQSLPADLRTQILVQIRATNVTVGAPDRPITLDSDVDPPMLDEG